MPLRAIRLPSTVALLLCVALPSLAFANSPPVVSNVVATQIAGTGKVKVTYDVSDADGDQVTTWLICSSNGGTSFDLVPVSVAGDVDKPIVVGPGKQIIWNAAADYPGRYFASVVAKVYASDGTPATSEMVLVPAGTFTMGSDAHTAEQPIRNVDVDAFYIDKYLVTNAEYKQFMDAGGYNIQSFWSADGWAWRSANSITHPGSWGDDATRSGPNWPGFPVRSVAYYEAEAYAAFVGKRLPTEAEWEKAARGTDGRTYPWGEGIDGSRANYVESLNPYAGGVAPVGFFDGRLNPNPPFQTTDSPSPYGAYDMAGNLLEWVKDWYGGEYLGYDPNQLTNPQGPTTGQYRVVRGGWYLSSATECRCASRSNHIPGQQIGYMGFRCAKPVP